MSTKTAFGVTVAALLFICALSYFFGLETGMKRMDYPVCPEMTIVGADGFTVKYWHFGVVLINPIKVICGRPPTDDEIQGGRDSGF